jgi:hypothetical protein
LGSPLDIDQTSSEDGGLGRRHEPNSKRRIDTKRCSTIRGCVLETAGLGTQGCAVPSRPLQSGVNGSARRFSSEEVGNRFRTRLLSIRSQNATARLQTRDDLPMQKLFVKLRHGRVSVGGDVAETGGV